MDDSPRTGQTKEQVSGRRRSFGVGCYLEGHDDLVSSLTLGVGRIGRPVFLEVVKHVEGFFQVLFGWGDGGGAEG